MQERRHGTGKRMLPCRSAGRRAFELDSSVESGEGPALFDATGKPVTICGLYGAVTDRA
jgi:hypothetical protein